jgi:hypothetical protein
MNQPATPLSIKTCLTESFSAAKNSRLAIWLPILASGLISMFIMLLLDSALPKTELIAGSWRQFAVAMLSTIVVMPIQAGIGMIALLKQRQQPFSAQTAFNYYPFFRNLAFIVIGQSAASFLFFLALNLMIKDHGTCMLLASGCVSFIFYFSALLCVDQKFNAIGSLRVSIKMLLHNNNWLIVAASLITVSLPKLLTLSLFLHSSLTSTSNPNPTIGLLLILLLPIVIYIEPVCIHLQAFTFRHIFKQKS